MTVDWWRRLCRHCRRARFSREPDDDREQVVHLCFREVPRRDWEAALRRTRRASEP